MTFNQIKSKTTVLPSLRLQTVVLIVFPDIVGFSTKILYFLINLCSLKICLVFLQKLIELITISVFIHLRVTEQKWWINYYYYFNIILVGCLCTSKFSTDLCLLVLLVNLKNIPLLTKCVVLLMFIHNSFRVTSSSKSRNVYFSF